MENTKTVKKIDVRRLVFTALLAAVSYLLAQFLPIKLPFMPSFLTFDFSDAPALLAAFTMGPVSGVFVVLIKNVIGCFTSHTSCIGELSNFLLGTLLVVPAGLIANKSQKFSRAVAAALAGAFIMAAAGFLTNFFIIYPLYGQIGMTPEAIISMYQKILPSVENLAQCLLIFNVPFTLAKGLTAGIISVVLYKKLRPVFNSCYRQ